MGKLFLNLRLLPVVCLLFFASCKKEVKNLQVNDNTLTFHKVVILGNSITYAPAYAPIGWYGSWGMAATTEAADYVHVLTDSLKTKDPNVMVKIKNIEAFEEDPTHYDFDVELKALKDLKPDLVVLCDGDDLTSASDFVTYEKRFSALIDYFKADNANTIVLSAGAVWSDHVDAIVQKHPPYVLLSSMLTIPGSLSFGLWTNPGIALHPSDKGMKYIATVLWSKISTFTKNDR